MPLSSFSASLPGLEPCYWSGSLPYAASSYSLSSHRPELESCLGKFLRQTTCCLKLCRAAPLLTSRLQHCITHLDSSWTAPHGPTLTERTPPPPGSSQTRSYFCTGAQASLVWVVPLFDLHDAQTPPSPLLVQVLCSNVTVAVDVHDTLTASPASLSLMLGTTVESVIPPLTTIAVLAAPSTPSLSTTNLTFELAGLSTEVQGLDTASLIGIIVGCTSACLMVSAIGWMWWKKTKPKKTVWRDTAVS